MQTELDVLRDVSEKLDSAGIAYMLTGSMAMSYYAQPRMTRDIDIVVALRREQAETISRLLETEYYVSREAVSDAIAGRTMFNAIHFQSVIKVDFIVLPNTSFAQEEFGRRRELTLPDFKTTIISREDLILSKLLWAKGSESEMQLRDVRNLLTSDCDLEYLRKWADHLTVKDGLERLLNANE